MSHTAPPAGAAQPSRLAWMPPAFRVVGLVATLVTIAALEYGAGKAAGWGTLAYGVPLAVDTFVLGVLLSPRSRLADRLFALVLVESTVVISAVWGDHAKGPDGKDPKVLLGAALATLLVAALWRQDETIRRERDHGDLLAEETARADAAERQVREAVARAAEVAVAARDVERQAEFNVGAAKEREDAAKNQATEFERRAVAAEARAAELDRRLREEATEREDRRRERTARAPRATSTQDDPTRKRRDAIRGLVEAGNPKPSKRDAVAAFERAGVGPGDNSKIVPLIEDVLTEIAAERAAAAGHPNLVPLPAAAAE